MSVPAVSGVLGVAPSGALGAGPAPLPGEQADGPGFGAALAGAIESLSSQQDRSTALGVQAVTGDLENVHEYTIAASEARVALELTVALRNKAVESFTEIMRMQA